MNFSLPSNLLKTTIPLTAGLVLLAGAAHAAPVDMMAVERTWTSAVTSEEVRMWGFAEGTVCPDPATDVVPWIPGPTITSANLGDNAGNTNVLQINLLNCLSTKVSIMIPGLSPIGAAAPVRNNAGRIRAFTRETGKNGGTRTYRWAVPADSPGPFLYMSGSHVAQQVHMGLYGAVVLGDAPQDELGNPLDAITLLYSEIDPALHVNATPARPLNYEPKYFLVNGKESLQEGDAINAGALGSPKVLHFLNAGLDFHVPTLVGSYMSLEYEDGNMYPFAKEQYSVNLPAGKTIVAYWEPNSSGTHTLYDRRGNGMVVNLDVGTFGGGGPLANPDFHEIAEDGTLAILAADGVLNNDQDDAGTPPPPSAGYTAVLVSVPGGGALSCGPVDGLCADGSFTYQPNADFSGGDSFTYKMVDPNPGGQESNTATVSLTVTAVNDAPVAVEDTYDVALGDTLIVDAPGVLGNDTDVDEDTLTVLSSTVPGMPSNPGDGSFTFTAEIPDGDGAKAFSYTASDPDGEVSATTITINVTNAPPEANDDTVVVKRNSTPANFPNRNVFNPVEPTAVQQSYNAGLTQDQDASGFNPNSLVVIGEIGGSFTTARGGTVENLGNNTVSYQPPRRWRGTDTFTYTVQDAQGLTSNTATVNVNVVRNRDLPEPTP